MPDDLPRLTLEWLPGRYAVCRLDPAAAVPGWLDSSLRSQAAGLLSITRTERELSVVIDESQLAGDGDADGDEVVQRGFVALRIAGTLDFALVGIIARLTSALADADISVFALSTYDTDILLVREHDRERATAALQQIATFASRHSP
jgi:hypothetical protein